MKLYKTKENEVYYYFLKSGDKRWMYRHRYVDTLGKRKEKSKSGFVSLNAALRSLLEVKAEILNGGSNYVDNDNMTVSQWIDIWYETESNSWEISTRKQREQIIENYIKPLLGHYKLSKLDRATYVREYINVMLKTLKPNTVQIRHTIFNIAINSAVENEIIPRNKFSKVKFEQTEKLDNFLTPDELNIFLKASYECLDITRYSMTLLLAYTGLRHGELAGLKWSDVDFKTNHITVKRTRDENGSRKPKTKRSYRTIPVDPLVTKQLKKYQTWCISTKLKYGEKLDKKKDYIFITEFNELCSREILRVAFTNVYLNLKNKKITINRITPHGLRHTHATVLIVNGIPAQTIADRLGNSVEMIYKVYTHSFEEMEQKAMTTFSHAVGFGGESGGR